MPTYAFAHEHSYSQTNSIVFLSDNLRNVLRDVIRECGLSPDRLMQDWKIIERGIRTWLESRHLNNVVVEFFKPGTTSAVARWDFPIGYAGSGAADDMWRDTNYLRQLISKCARPSTDCVYRILLCTNAGAPKVEGFSNCDFLSTGSLVARQAGTVIATGHLTAGVTYWK